MAGESLDASDIPPIVDISYCICNGLVPHSIAGEPCRSNSHWLHALSEIRKVVYTNSSASIPGPSNFLFDAKHKDLIRQTGNNPKLNSLLKAYDFNEKPNSTVDIFEYQKQRSEHVLIRLAHNVISEFVNYTCVRIAKGVFMFQQSKYNKPLDLLTRIGVVDPDIENRNEIPINTFSFDALFEEMMAQTQQREPFSVKDQDRLFIPFTYTIGVRYTNPYQGARDIVVRGKIPLWCQTLFLTNCMHRLPILPGAKISGLLSFVNDMEFEFKALCLTTEDSEVSEPYPELLVYFEQFAMELCDPQLIWKNVDTQGNSWKDIQRSLLNNTLFCDIPDEQASYITSVANQWAISQGLLLQ